MRFYANENFPRRATEHLRRMGHDVLTTLQAGNAGLNIPDSDVVAFAAADRRVVLSLNRRDFIRLHAMSQDHHGILVCFEDLDFERLAERIHELVGDDAESAVGQLLRLSRR